MFYDVVGDVHANVDKLGALLRKLGYGKRNGGWGHPNRKVIFVGDFVDRGPSQVATYRLVRSMVDGGNALAVMGNHELNAIAYYTPDNRGGYLREHTRKNTSQHRAFLDEVASDPSLHREIVEWFLELPLWLDLPEIRVVHACWDDQLMDQLQPLLSAKQTMPSDLLKRATQGATNSYRSDGAAPAADVVFRSVETILKGIEIDLPDGVSFPDKDGHERFNVRMRWWETVSGTFRQQGMMPTDQQALLPEIPVPAGVLPGYRSAKPVFFGHYWMTGAHKLQAPRVACVDYSAGASGPLTAYRWSGEKTLDVSNFLDSSSR